MRGWYAMECTVHSETDLKPLESWERKAGIGPALTAWKAGYQLNRKDLQDLQGPKNPSKNAIADSFLSEWNAIGMQ